MQGWLQKVGQSLAKTTDAKPRAQESLPVVQRTGALPAQQVRRTQPAPNASLPNATVIYGIGASFMFVAAVSLLLAGRWFPALGVFALGACLLGFALHLLKHHD